MRNRRKVSGKQIERCVISTFQIAESMGFKGEFRQWESCCELAIRVSAPFDVGFGGTKPCVQSWPE